MTNIRKLLNQIATQERNLSTQPYYRSDVGAFKAKILALIPLTIVWRVKL